jgi:hypothetical protein
MPAVHVETRAGPRDFSGERIAHSDTPNTKRWIEFDVYRLDDEAGYAVVRGGMSLVYHTARTSCTTAGGGRAGVPVTAARMFEVVKQIAGEAEPVSCDKCRPTWPEDLGGEDQIRFEMPRMTVDMHPTADKAIKRLTTVRDRDTGVEGTFVSKPVEQLLEEAARNDAGFAMALVPQSTMEGPAHSIGQLDS